MLCILGIWGPRGLNLRQGIPLRQRLRGLFKASLAQPGPTGSSFLQFFIYILHLLLYNHALLRPFTENEKWKKKGLLLPYWHSAQKPTCSLR